MPFLAKEERSIVLCPLHYGNGITLDNRDAQVSVIGRRKQCSRDFYSLHAAPTKYPRTRPFHTNIFLGISWKSKDVEWMVVRGSVVTGIFILSWSCLAASISALDGISPPPALKILRISQNMARSRASSRSNTARAWVSL